MVRRSTFAAVTLLLPVGFVAAAVHQHQEPEFTGTLGRLSLEAMSLVYTTLLSLVPLLAVSFSVLKGFGVHKRIEPLLLRNARRRLLPTAPAEVESLLWFSPLVAARSSRDIVLHLGVARLLAEELAALPATGDDRQGPTPLELAWDCTRLHTRHWSAVLLFSAIATSASLRSAALVERLASIEPLGFLLQSAERLVPYALITMAFTFVYSFVPNTRVRLVPALVGASVGGLLWLAAGNLFAQFMAGSTRYAAIYSGLAILILFMIWVYIAWLIVLIGANIAFYVQYPEYLASPERDVRLSNRLRERVALQLMQRIVQRHFAGIEGATEDELAHAVGMPLANVRRLVGRAPGEPDEDQEDAAADDIECQHLAQQVRVHDERVEPQGHQRHAHQRPKHGLAHGRPPTNSAASTAPMESIAASSMPTMMCFAIAGGHSSGAPPGSAATPTPSAANTPTPRISARRNGQPSTRAGSRRPLRQPRMALRRVVAQKARRVAVNQRTRGHHLRVEQRMPAQQAREEPVVAVRPVHHRGDGQAAVHC